MPKRGRPVVRRSREAPASSAGTRASTGSEEAGLENPSGSDDSDPDEEEEVVDEGEIADDDTIFHGDVAIVELDELMEEQLEMAQNAITIANEEGRPCC